MAGIGQNWSLAGASPNVRLQIRKQSFKRITAAQNDFFFCYVDFAILKRKWLTSSGLVT
jgi:hypothetical protein